MYELPHCQDLEEDPNCHPWMRINWLGCSGTAQEPSRLKCELETVETPTSLSTVKQVLHPHGLRDCQPRKKAPASKSTRHH